MYTSGAIRSRLARLELRFSEGEASSTLTLSRAPSAR